MPILPHPRPAPGTTIDAAPALHVRRAAAQAPQGRRPLVTPIVNGVTYDAVGPGASTGCSYDYRAQQWRDGHDHSHLSTAHPAAPPLYCGADLDTCAPLTHGGTA